MDWIWGGHGELACSALRVKWDRVKMTCFARGLGATYKRVLIEQQFSVTFRWTYFSKAGRSEDEYRRRLSLQMTLNIIKAHFMTNAR